MRPVWDDGRAHRCHHVPPHPKPDVAGVERWGAGPRYSQQKLTRWRGAGTRGHLSQPQAGEAFRCRGPRPGLRPLGLPQGEGLRGPITCRALLRATDCPTPSRVQQTRTQDQGLQTHPCLLPGREASEIPLSGVPSGQACGRRPPSPRQKPLKSALAPSLLSDC